jgi:hypothetical protein
MFLQAEEAASKAPKLEAGQRVKANRAGQRAQFEGVITRARRNGTYDVSFDDGAKQSSIPRSQVKVVEKKVVFETFGI